MYSLGVIIYYLFENKLPFDRKDEETWLEAKLLRPHLEFSVLDAQWGSVVSKLLSPAPTDRYRSAYGAWSDMMHGVSAGGRLGETEANFPLQFAAAQGDWTALLAEAQALLSGGALQVGFTGPQGCGKSTVLRKLREVMWQQGDVCCLLSSAEMADPRWPHHVDSEWRRQIAARKAGLPHRAVLLADCGEITARHLEQLGQLRASADYQVIVFATADYEASRLIGETANDWSWLKIDPPSYESVLAWMRQALGDMPSLKVLTSSIYHWAAGNMTMIRGQLIEWAKTGKLAYDLAQRIWRWDAALLEDLPRNDRGDELRLQQLQMMSAELQHLLTAAAVIGDRFTLTELCELIGLPRSSLGDELLPA
ncbi:MAG: hypothetical protein J7559_23630, partial [Cohnella sp.]|nr:hypothetical protein [Cohnella sp.]